MAMINATLTLTEGVPETLSFQIFSKDNQPVDLSGTHWWAVLRMRDDAETIEIPAKVDFNTISVTFPALSAEAADWELWRSGDIETERLLAGPATIFPVLSVEALATTTNTARSFAIKTDDNSTAYLLKAMPGNAALACLEKIRQAYNEALTLRRIKVDSLPAPEQASPYAVYFLNGTPWVPLAGEWVQYNTAYGLATPDMPGLLRVNDEKTAAACAPIVSTETGYGIPLAPIGSQNQPGAVILGQDFIANDAKSGLMVRRANAQDALPGLISITGTAQEISGESPSGCVYSTAKTDERIRELHEFLSAEDLQNKLDTNASNLHTGMDIVVEHGYDEETGRWYRLWKSGWLEQGGFLPTSSNYHSGSFYFMKPFKPLVYHVTIQNSHTSYCYAPSIAQKNDIFFKYHGAIGPNIKPSVYACGFYNANYVDN